MLRGLVLLQSLTRRGEVISGMAAPEATPGAILGALSAKAVGGSASQADAMRTM